MSLRDSADDATGWAGKAFLGLLVIAQAVIILHDPLNLFHDDALFYLQIAWNISQGSGPVFSLGLPTNGFHPAWLLVLTGTTSLVGSKAALAVAAATLFAVLNAVSLVALYRLLTGIARPWAACLGLAVAAPFMMLAGVGMESGLVCLLLALFLIAFLRFLVRPKGRGLVLSALLAGLVVFAHLDLALLLALPGLGAIHRYLAGAEGPPDRLWAALWIVAAAITFLLPVGLWLAYNVVAFEHPVPISGLLKFSATGDEAGRSFLTGVVLVLAALVVAGLALSLRSRDARGLLVVALASGEVMYLAYLILWASGEVYSWYFTQLALVASVCTAFALDRLLPRRLGPWVEGSALPTLGLWALAVVVASAGLLRYGLRDGLPDQPGPDEPGMAAQAAAAGISRVLAFDRPGQLAYLQGFDLIALDGLTTNHGFQQELRSQGMGWVIDTYDIDGIVVPRLGDPFSPDICGDLYLGAMRFVCRADASGNARLAAVEFHSKLDGSFLGQVRLPEAARVEIPNEIGFELYGIGPKDFTR